MRKSPRQARSRATVQAIVQAGARVLGERGWPAFSTNHVAAAAGASIGSLYQYFPDKHALVEAIRLRHLRDVLDALRIANGSSGPPRARVEQLVDGLIAAHASQPGLHRVLLELVPRGAGPVAVEHDFDMHYLGAYLGFVVALRPGEPDAEAVARVLASAVEGVIHEAARKGSVASPAIRRELIAMICAYLGVRS